LGDPRIRPPSN